MLINFILYFRFIFACKITFYGLFNSKYPNLRVFASFSLPLIFSKNAQRRNILFYIFDLFFHIESPPHYTTITETLCITEYFSWNNFTYNIMFLYSMQIVLFFIRHFLYHPNLTMTINFNKLFQSN